MNRLLGIAPLAVIAVAAGCATNMAPSEAAPCSIEPLDLAALKRDLSRYLHPANPNHAEATNVLLQSLCVGLNDTDVVAAPLGVLEKGLMPVTGLKVYNGDTSLEIPNYRALMDFLEKITKISFRESLFEQSYVTLIQEEGLPAKVFTSWVGLDGFSDQYPEFTDFAAAGLEFGDIVILFDEQQNIVGVFSKKTPESYKSEPLGQTPDAVDLVNYFYEERLSDALRQYGLEIGPDFVRYDPRAAQEA